jgi:hypothetical protein
MRAVDQRIALRLEVAGAALEERCDALGRDCPQLFRGGATRAQRRTLRGVARDREARRQCITCARIVGLKLALRRRLGLPAPGDPDRFQLRRRC